MKEIKLTQGKVALVDDEDFEYLNQWKWFVQIDTHNCYAKRAGKSIKGKRYMISMHRVIMNTPYDLVVDHIDHNGLNNHKSNLRNCTRSQNAWNYTPCGKSKYLGVGYSNKQIQCHISINGIDTYLGTFKSEIEAAEYFDKKAKEIYGEFANLNFKT